MWKLVIKRRLRRHITRNAELTHVDILHASTILFSVFARYGDSIMAFKAIDEFMSLYPGKNFILVTSPQMVPYAVKIINGKLELYSVNKRKNLIKFLMIMRTLGRRKIDLGLNPWSHGDDSKFFITFASKFSTFGTFSNVSRGYNLYKLIRDYLLMETPATTARVPELSDISSILISPFSTDITKSLGAGEVEALISQITLRFPKANITIALKKEESRNLGWKTDLFFFGKSLKKSEEFLKLLEASDLFIGVDAGPLHLADALGIRAIGIFGPTAPESILDRSSTVLPVRHPQLNGIFCFVRQCKNPVCIEELFKDNFLSHTSRLDFDRRVLLETEKCPLEK